MREEQLIDCVAEFTLNRYILWLASFTMLSYNVENNMKTHLDILFIYQFDFMCIKIRTQ